MDVFCKALAQNKTLISLNVANNGLSADVGKKFEAMLKENSTLIDFEFGFNDFGLEEVSQSRLKPFRSVKYRMPYARTRLCMTLTDCASGKSAN